MLHLDVRRMLHLDVRRHISTDINIFMSAPPLRTQAFALRH